MSDNIEVSRWAKIRWYVPSREQQYRSSTNPMPEMCLFVDIRTFTNKGGEGDGAVLLTREEALLVAKNCPQRYGWGYPDKPHVEVELDWKIGG